MGWSGGGFTNRMVSETPAQRLAKMRWQGSTPGTAATLAGLGECRASGARAFTFQGPSPSGLGSHLAGRPSPGFPVELGGFGELYAPFFMERRTRGSLQCNVAGNPGPGLIREPELVRCTLRTLQSRMDHGAKKSHALPLNKPAFRSSWMLVQGTAGPSGNRTE